MSIKREQKKFYKKITLGNKLGQIIYIDFGFLFSGISWFFLACHVYFSTFSFVKTAKTGFDWERGTKNQKIGKCGKSKSSSPLLDEAITYSYQKVTHKISSKIEKKW